MQIKKEIEAAEAQNPGGKSISDEDMAAQLAKDRRKKPKTSNDRSIKPEEHGEGEAMKPMYSGSRYFRRSLHREKNERT